MSKQNAPKKAKKSNRGIIITFAVCAIAVIAVGGIFLSNGYKKSRVSVNTGDVQNTANQDATQNESAASTPKAESTGKGITITDSEVTETALFIPYKVGETKMEVVAVRAPDNTIRTAFNTCQVCYTSKRGYYVQEGNELVCQNCGNRFDISAIEKQKNGCNPVPITDEYKTDDGTTITITDELLRQAAQLFKTWEKPV